MGIYELGRQIAKFAYDVGDLYELRDVYESYEQMETETIIGLCQKTERKGIAKWLQDVYYDASANNEAEVCERAQKLYGEVVAI